MKFFPDGVFSEFVEYGQFVASQLEGRSSILPVKYHLYIKQS